MLDITNSSLLILSDIHACAGDASASNAESYVSTTVKTGSLDPFGDLERVLSPFKGAVCGVVCPGDLTNKADENGVNFVWQRLRSIAEFLGAPLVAATPGNHDLDSRFSSTDFDARGIAMLVEPPMPNCERVNYLEFWAEHFTIFEKLGARFVALNSAAYHGTGKDPAEEMERGRVSEPTLKMLKSRLEIEGSRKTNILICHHHPAPHDEITEKDYSEIEGGGKLLRLLADGGYGPWLVIHGHKHRPRLFYSAGNASSPVILGAASFSAQINRDASNKSPNQFHLLNLSSESERPVGSDLSGQVRSWNWTIGEGWKPASGDFGFPSICGFGYRNSISALNDKVLDELRKEEFFEWEKLSSLVTELKFLLPTDERTLISKLKDGGVRILRDDNGRPVQLSLETA